LEFELKIKNIVAATAITAWSGLACAGYVTTFGQNVNTDASFPLTFYPEVVIARDEFVGSQTPNFYDFEALSAPVGATSLSFDLNGVGVTLSGDGQVRRNETGETNSGRYSVSGVSSDMIPAPQGNKYWEVVAPTSGASSFNLDFGGQAVQSFGFFATDVGDFKGLLSLELTRMNGSTFIVEPGDLATGGPIRDNTAAGSVLFFGVSTSIESEYFKAVRFISSGGTDNDMFGFDMFTVIAAPGGGTIPLPGSLALVGAALGGLALVRRRR
jgi:hypothetical protein